MSECSKNCFFKDSESMNSETSCKKIQHTYDQQKLSVLQQLRDSFVFLPRFNTDIINLILQFSWTWKEFVASALLHACRLSVTDMYFQKPETITLQYLSRQVVIITGSNAGTEICFECFLLHFLSPDFNICMRCLMDVINHHLYPMSKNYYKPRF